MIEPEIMVAWLQRRIHSSEMWLSDFSAGKRKRPDTEIESKRFDVQALQEILGAYLKAVNRRNQPEIGNARQQEAHETEEKGISKGK